MTLITVWLDPDCWDEHFLFYNLLQNINSLKDILQIPWTLLGPSFKGLAHSAWHKMKDLLKLNNFCSILFNKIFTSNVFCLKKMPQKWALLEYRFSTPTLTRKIKIIKKTKTDVHNYNVSSIQIHLIWFSSFSTFGDFVWKPKPEKNL